MTGPGGIPGLSFSPVSGPSMSEGGYQTAGGLTVNKGPTVWELALVVGGGLLLWRLIRR